MQFFFKYLSVYKKESILGPAFKFLEACFELMIPLLIINIVDIGINGNDRNYIIKMCLIMVTLGVIGLTCSITAQYFAAKASTGFSSSLRHDLINHIQKFSYKDIDNLGTSTLITRITSDVVLVQNGVNLALRLLLRSPFVVLGAMIMAFTIDIKLALVFVILIPILCLIVFGIMLFTMPIYKNAQGKLDGVTKITRENLSGVRVLRAFRKEKSEMNNFGEQIDSLYLIQKFVSKISTLLNPLTLICVNISIVALIYFGSIQVNIGSLTQGEVLALYNYMSQILVELIKAADLIIMMTKAGASAQRINNILDTKSTEYTSDGELNKDNENLVEFKNVSLKYFEHSETVLNNISFTAKAGETVGVIGGTGSGKTSLINLIPAFYKASSGEVKITGKNALDINGNVLRKNVAVVPQKAVLFTGDIKSNLSWGNNNANYDDMYKALEIAQAKEVVDDKNGLETIVSQGGRNFSGGQKQRLTIARAIISGAKILILDDSASALDYATDFKLRKSISDMKNPPLTFIVSQRASSVLNADKILVLEHGNLVGMGKHTDLIDTCDVYKEIYYSQFPKEEAIK